MPFAIQYGLIISNCISCIPAVPFIIQPVDSDKFHEALSAFFYVMPAASDLPLLKLMMKFQFVALFALYVLGVFAGIYVPAVTVGYMFALGNLLRVAYFGVLMLDTEKFVMSGMKKEQLRKILIIQTVLAVVMFGCTLLSSMSAEYQAFAAGMADDASSKWETDGFYIKFLFAAHAFFALTSVPGFLAPSMAIKQYIPIELMLPHAKESNIVLEFSMGFQQLAVLMIQAFGAVMLWYSPSIDGLATFWLCAVPYFTVLIFCFNIIHADKYGFDRVPMLVFMSLNLFVMGASFMALFA